MIAASVAAGAAASAVLFLVFGASLMPFEALNEANGVLAHVHPGDDFRRVRIDNPDFLLAHPLFASAGAGVAAVDPEVRVFGIARSPEHAALLSLGDKPARWQGLGVTRDGVTVREVGTGEVVVDTAAGSKTLPLWSNPPPPVTPVASPTPRP